MNSSAFKSKLRLIDNSRKIEETGNDRLPPTKLAMDFTPDQANAMAAWLIAAAEQAEAEGRTIRVYQGQNDYEEVVGFTAWGSLWGTSGEMSPLPIEPGGASAAPARSGGGWGKGQQPARAWN